MLFVFPVMKQIQFSNYILLLFFLCHACYLRCYKRVGHGSLFLGWWQPSVMWVSLLIFINVTTSDIWILFESGVMCYIWAHFMCHLEQRSAPVGHLLSFLNISLTLAMENITKNTIPIQNFISLYSVFPSDQVFIAACGCILIQGIN